MDIYSQTIYNFFKHDNDFNAMATFHSLNVLIIRKLNLAIGTIDKGFLGATNVIRDYLRNSEDATKFNNEWLEKIK